MELGESIEVRWFLPTGDGRVALLEDWFADGHRESVRVDWYLNRARDDLGVKLRIESSKPPKLELKFLLGAIGPLRAAPSIQGDVEHWRKLSLEAGPETSAGAQAWFEVQKDRTIRKFAFDSGRITRVAATDRPAAGCNAEFTKLAVPSTKHEQCTFGLEAFGPTADLLTILMSTARELFPERPGLVLGAEHSTNYARWVLENAKVTT